MIEDMKDQPEVVIDDTGEPDKTQEPAIEVDLERKEAPKKEPEKPAYLTKRDWELEREKNRQYQNRQLENLRLQIANEVKAALESVKTTKQEPIEGEFDEDDKLAHKDWKAAVRKLAKEQADDLYKSYVQQGQSQETERLRSQMVERSRAFVLSQYPQLSDEASDESKVFVQVWNENPSIWNNPEGFRLAMYEMEERMRSMGRPPSRVKLDVDKEVKRQLRANISNISGRTLPANGNKIVLTKEQKEFCDHNSIPYDVYARQVRADREVVL